MKFAAIGLDHRHIYDMVGGLLDAGADCAGFWTREDTIPLAGFVERFPHIPRVSDRQRLLDDTSIRLIACAAIPNERADFAIAAMRHGKDVVVDKPGVTTLAQLQAVQRTVRETGRIFSVAFGERCNVRAVTRATELVRAGAIGRVIQTIGLGPHRLNRHLRPDWFFRRDAYGGILADIGAHQIDQFLHFAGADDARIVLARAGNLGHPEYPELEDFGELVLQAGGVSGYVRVDWFTPDGLPTWGDGRLTILGTEGYLELRKFVDIAGRPGTDHLFLVDRNSTRRIDCADAALPYYPSLCADVRDRTETAMTQAHCLRVCHLALTAQAQAVRIDTTERRDP